ncbi:hypothetical protein D1007_57215 [Hordeum vulgare]|nr:hypothetical protein D1007_57215 [Hordeum vulgare]
MMRHVASPAERAAYLKWMDMRCFRCLRHKHFPKHCEEPLKCWRFYNDFHLASQCPGPPSKLSSLVPPSGTRLAVGADHDASVGPATRQCSYTETLTAPPIGDRSTCYVNCCIFPRAPVEQDLIAAMLSAGPVGINPWNVDPMLDQAMSPSPQIFPAINGPMDCSTWGDDMWFSNGAKHGRTLHSSVHQMPSPEEPLDFTAPNLLDEPAVDVYNVVAKVAQTKATTISLEDFLSKVTCLLPQPLLGTLVPSHGEKNDGQRSQRLEKKNKACNILTSKRAGYRMLEFFGELPEVKKAEGLEQKMQAYVDLYKKNTLIASDKALSFLARIVGKSKLDL